MEALLVAWRQRPEWLRVDGASYVASPPEDSQLTQVEWMTWIEILRIAEPVPPRTTTDGLTVYAALHGLNVDSLKDHVVLVVGQRVATRWLAAAQEEAARLGGHSWSVIVRPEAARIEREACECVLRKCFREVEFHGDAFLASTAWGGRFESVSFLLGDAVAHPISVVLRRLWRLARALELESAFLDQLPSFARKTLADVLEVELTTAIEHLDVKTDTKLEFFAEGHDDVSFEEVPRALPLPSSRLTSLLATKGFQEHLPREFGGHYFDHVAAAYARVAETYSLGDLLKRLPPGRTLFAAIERICRYRPELIATYLWHPAYHAEGAFALLQLPPQRSIAPRQSLDLSDEWLEIQRLGREQLVLAERSEDWHSIVALGIHDEAQSIGRKHYGTPPLPRQRLSYGEAQIWSTSVATPDRARMFLDILDSYFHKHTKRADAATIFALNLLVALRAALQQSNARRLARAIVDGYIDTLTLDAGVLSVPDVICAYGSNLEVLRETLHDETVDESWAKWLRPFDSAEYVKQAHDNATMVVDSRTINPTFDVPRTLRAHAEALIAQASASEKFEEALDAALDLYFEDRRAELPVEAFSWNALAQTTATRVVVGCEPLFVRVGRLFARSARGVEHLERLLNVSPQAHILAYVFLGLGDQNGLAGQLQPKLRELLNGLLMSTTGLALGHALELASVLHQAGLAREAERFARRTLEIVEYLRPHERQPYSDVAYAILAGALAQQQQWAEILALKPNIQDLASTLFISNMRAVAMMELRQFAEARNLLDEVLSKAPTDRTALVNITAFHVYLRDWAGAIDAAQQAKAILSPEDWDSVLINEAVAREQLGDKFGAATLLRSISVGARAYSDVRATLERLRRGTTSAALSARKDVSFHDAIRNDVPESTLTNAFPVNAEPSDAVDIAIVTALPEEYEAVRVRLTDWQPIQGSTGQYANLYGWALGSISKSDGTGKYRVVLALAGRSGNLRTAMTTVRTIDRWAPRHVLFSGIAGGLKKDGLKHGDIALSQNIWYYEYGKVVDGYFVPRHRDSFVAHSGLFASACLFNGEVEQWINCGVQAPSSDHVPKLVPGTIGSGEKVIDDLSPDFVRRILAARPELLAVEMEAAGACAAIQQAYEEGRAVGFIMVRGISDMPKGHVSFIKEPVKAISSWLQRTASSAGAGTKYRDNWKLYASAISAHFIVSWIASSRWPEQPRC